MVRRRTDSVRGRTWLIPEPHESAPIPDTPYPDFVTRLLRRRGLSSAQEARRFLFDEPSPPPDAARLPGLGPALDRLTRAIRDGEAIAVYGDFDVDGVTATAILTEAIRQAGGHVRPYIPDRFGAGYGLHPEALHMLRRRHGVTLVVTADCGISAVDEVAYARRQGQDVVIVDHHSVPSRLPDATAIVNPKLPESEYGFAELTTGGLAYRIAPLLLERLGGRAEPDRWLDLATLSTIADVAPLVAENRHLVREGLQALRDTRRPGLQALLEVSGLTGRDLDTEAVSFALSPRLNAAGRLDHARHALDLLVETDPARAGERARALDRLNVQRRQMTVEAMRRARARLAEQDAETPISIVGDPEIPSGIIGLVAGRLAEERYRPAVVYEARPDFCRASCRSIPEFNIAAALDACADLLVRHGGHPMAAGFTARPRDIDALRDRLTRLAAAHLADVALHPRLEVDAQTPLEAVGAAQVQWLLRLGPFGQANPTPTFVSRAVPVAEVRRVGADGDHLRLLLRAGDRLWPGIGFGLGGATVAPGDRVDVAWSLRPGGPYGGVELDLRDLAPPTLS